MRRRGPRLPVAGGRWRSAVRHSCPRQNLRESTARCASEWVAGERLPVAGERFGHGDARERTDGRSLQSMATKRPQQAQAGEPFSWVFVPRRGESFRLSSPGPWCPRAGRFSPRVRVSADNGLYSRAASPHNRRFQPTPTPMGNLKKKRRLKMAKHKRRKRLKANRHKKRTWQK